MIPAAAGIVSVAGAIALAVAAASGREVDFEVYRMGAAYVTGPHLYQALLPHHNLPFTYPPFAALAFWPFTWLPGHAGQLAWSCLDVVAVAALIAVSIRASGADWPRTRVWGAAAIALLPVLLLNPALTTLYYGQVNFLIVLLVVLDLTCVIRVRGKTLPRGVLLGVACAVKLTPLVFIPFLLVTRQFRAAAVSIGTFVLCGLAAFAVAPASSAAYWTSKIFASARSGNLLYISDQNLRSALDRILQRPPTPPLLDTLTVILGVGGLAVAAWADRTSSRTLGILLCAATGLIVSPISWSHHYVWVVPVLAWLLLAPERPRGGRWWALAVAVLFSAAPILWVPDPQDGYGGPLVLLAGNSFFISAVIFLLLASLLLWLRARHAMRGA